jgi:hypothetical protein
VPKSLCQSPFPDADSVKRAGSETVVADRPQPRTDTWTRGADRTPTVAPPVRSRRLQGRHGATTHPHSRPCPLSRPLGARAEHRGAIAAVGFLALVHRRRRATPQFLPAAPPQRLPLPSPLLPRVVGVKVRPHWPISPPRHVQDLAGVEAVVVRVARTLPSLPFSLH